MTKQESMQSLGGRARAEMLSPDERTGIARAAAAARWNIPRASHQGKLSIGGYEINCAVLEGGIRVLSERSIAKALGIKGGGAHWKRKKEGGADLPEYLSVGYIRERLKPELVAKLNAPIRYLSVAKVDSKGLEASVLQEICDFWIELKQSGALQPQHDEIADKALILMRGFTKVGIIALVDEATGYQEVRDSLALRAILDKYITDEWAKWSKTFPDEFYTEMFRLRGVAFPPQSGSKKPGYVGHWTNDLVYSRLAPGVLQELRKVNPTSMSGGRKRKHFQYLTVDVDNPALREHLTKIIFLMKAFSNGDWGEFKKALDRASQKFGNTIPMDV